MEEADLNRRSEEGLILVRGEDRSLFWSARGLLAAGFRHKRSLISCFCGILLLAALAAILGPREYQSEAKILVKHERADPLVTPGAERAEAHDYAISGEELNSEVELIRSEDLLRKVVMACGLAGQSTDEHKQQRNIAGAVVRLSSRLKVEVMHKTNILSVAYTSPSPELSARVVNTVVSSYLAKHVAVHSSSELEFFDLQVAQYRKELEKAEDALAAFSQRKDGVVSPATQREAVLQRENEFSAMLQQTRSGVAETRERIRTLEEEAHSTPSRVTTQLRSTDNPQVLQDLRATLLKLQLKRTELLTKYQPNYPPVRELEQEIAETEAALSSAESSPLRDQTTDVNPTRQWIDSELPKAKAELRSLESRVSNLANTVQNYDREAHYMDEQQLRHEDLVRNAKSAEENYLLYVRKREEARITNALDQRRILNVTVIEPATQPYLPNRSGTSYLLKGLILALVVTAGMLFMLEHVDNTFRTPRELEHFLPVPVLAAVPVEHRLSSGTTPQASG
jgi:uncharacterized protein involved in exopolysaccharide biosynthesis